jgi:hypothetical protein
MKCRNVLCMGYDTGRTTNCFWNDLTGISNCKHRKWFNRLAKVLMEHNPEYYWYSQLHRARRMLARIRKEAR